MYTACRCGLISNYTLYIYICIYIYMYVYIYIYIIHRMFHPRHYLRHCTFQCTYTISHMFIYICRGMLVGMPCAYHGHGHGHGHGHSHGHGHPCCLSVQGCAECIRNDCQEHTLNTNIHTWILTSCDHLGVQRAASMVNQYPKHVSNKIYTCMYISDDQTYV
jgi:hypothetical protein